MKNRYYGQALCMCVRERERGGQNPEYLWCQLWYQLYEVDVSSKIAPFFRMKIMKTQRGEATCLSHTIRK